MQLNQKMVQTSQLFLVAASLAGCASQSIIMPSAQSRSDEEIAILKIDRTVKGHLRPELNSIFDFGTGLTILPSRGFHDYYQIKLAPGQYHVMLKVYSANYAPAFPAVNINAKPGMTYLFASSVVLNSSAVKAEYKEISTKSDIAPAKGE